MNIASSLSNYIAAFADFNVAVVGDLMLDRYVKGTAERISQEAPVPVVLVSGKRDVPGGAANVARNLTSLGAHAEVFGHVGTDLEGDRLVSLLAEAGVSVNGVSRSDHKTTTIKTRVLAGNQQVVRIDEEQAGSFPKEVEDDIFSRLEKRMSQGKLHAVILEDYAKGLFNEQFMERIVNLCNERNVLVALDPHSSHAFNVKGITIMTPNRSEALALAEIKSSRQPEPSAWQSDELLFPTGKRLLQQWGLDYLLITLGANGMALFHKDNPNGYDHIPTLAKQVFDVSGAGDTVMATTVLGILSQASTLDACKIANVAASVVVGRVGTSAIEADVLAKELALFDEVLKNTERLNFTGN